MLKSDLEQISDHHAYSVISTQKRLDKRLAMYIHLRRSYDYLQHEASGQPVGEGVVSSDLACVNRWGEREEKGLAAPRTK
jgi:hypothetical protein